MSQFSQANPQKNQAHPAQLPKRVRNQVQYRLKGNIIYKNCGVNLNTENKKRGKFEELSKGDDFP